LPAGTALKNKGIVDFHDSMRLDYECARINEILGTALFQPRIQDCHPLFWSAITEVLINLRDLCWFADKAQARLAWSDDLSPNTLCKDVTDLITFCRDGLCHSHTYHKYIDRDTEMVGIKNIVTGKNDPDLPGMRIGGIELRCEYDNEVALFIGKERLYLKRHIVRAFHELVRIFVQKGLLEAEVWRSQPRLPVAGPPQNTTE
ncbi:MAG: hypothetical protein WAO00_02940, partial [Chthoniobacterales bacterium]